MYADMDLSTIVHDGAIVGVSAVDWWSVFASKGGSGY